MGMIGDGADGEEVWLITGATGFIGQHLISYLNEELCAAEQQGGRRVRLLCVCRSTSDQLQAVLRRGRDLDKRGLLRLRFADLSDGEALRSVVPGDVTVAIHSAAQGGDWGRDELFVSANELGTRNLCAVLREQCPNFRRFVHVSTVDVYPRGVRPEQCREDAVEPVTRSRYGYSRTKAAAERIVRAAGFREWTVLRPGVVIGAGSHSWGLTEAGLMLQGRGCLVDGGQYTSGLVYVDDVVDAVVRAARAPAERVHGQCFNIADPEQSGSWRDFYDLLADGIGCSRVRRSLPAWLLFVVAWLLEAVYRLMGWYDDRPIFTFFLLRLIAQHQLWPVDNARQRLGWRARTPLRVAVQHSLPWIKQELAKSGLLPTSTETSKVD